MEKRKLLRRKSDREMLDLLNQKFSDHEISDTENFNAFHVTLGDIRDEFRQYVADDEKWKTDNQGALDNMRNITGISKFGLGAVVTIGAALYGVTQIVNFFKHKV